MPNVIIGVLIFGYAGWMLFRFVRKSKKGTCASCSINASCAKNQCLDIDDVHKID
jgi:hypothetical protein